MAFEKSEPTKQKKETQANETEAPDQGFYNESTQPLLGGNNLLDMNASVSASMSRHETIEVLRRADTAISEILDKNKISKSALKRTLIDAEKYHLPISGILLTTGRRIQGQQVAMSFLLLVEASADELVPRSIPVGRGPAATIPAVAGDCIDDNLESLIEQLSHDFATGADHDFLGGAVIPREVELNGEDRNLRTLLFNALAALDGATRIRAGATTITAKEISRDNTLSARLDMDHAPGVSQSGLPIREDITIDLRAMASRNNSSFGEPSQPKQQLVSHLGGFMDVAYNGDHANDGPGWGARREPNTRVYSPRFIVTNSHSGFNFETLEMKLLALAQVALLARGNNWANAFRPRHTKHLDMHDIGGIGYDKKGPTGGTRISTDPKEFDEGDFEELIQTIFPSDSLVVSMDIDETGPLTWLDDVMVEAAMGEPHAIDAIVDAADRISNGNFSAIYPGGPIAELEDIRIPLGYYESEDGTRRDLRDADYLSVLNLTGKNDLNAIDEWCETMYDFQTPSALRLEKQLGMITRLFGGSVSVKGYARRINLTANLINALGASMEAAGIHVSPDNLQHEMGSRTVYGMKGTANYALGSNADGGMYRSNMGSNLGRSPIARRRSRTLWR